MKKSIPAVNAVTGFLFAAAAIALSVIFIKLFFESLLSIKAMYGNENYALAFLLFGWLIFSVTGLLFILFVACAGFGAYSIAAGIVTILCIKSGNAKRIFIFSVINLVLSALAAVSLFTFALCIVVQMSFDYIGIIVITAFAVSAVSVLTNSLYIAKYDK